MLIFPVDCIWTAWSVWGTCDSGSGVKVRSRIKDQEALNGGTECPGDATETQDCPGKDLFVIGKMISQSYSICCVFFQWIAFGLPGVRGGHILEVRNPRMRGARASKKYNHSNFPPIQLM